MSVSPEHSMGNLEGTTMCLLFLHLHKVKQTMTVRIGWKTSENRRMQFGTIIVNESLSPLLSVHDALFKLM